MTGFSVSTFRTTVVFAVLAFSFVNVVLGELSCTSDRDCPADKYCYNVSRICVNFTPCFQYNRVEGPTPKRQGSQCGPCFEGYVAEVLGEGEPGLICRPVNQDSKTSKETQTEPEIELKWSWHWIALTIIVILVLVVSSIIVFKRLCMENRDKMCKKMMPWSVTPTAPPQDEVTRHLRSKAFHIDEEQPPIYSSVIRTNVVNDNIVNTTPFTTPQWVGKPHYQPDFNDNVTDGAAIPIHISSNNIPIDIEDEEETNPSSWTPGQLIVDVPSRPFARFGSEQQENAFNNVLLQGNCSPDSPHEEENSDDSQGTPEEGTSSRSHNDRFCGPNVQINQMITLNISKNGNK